MQLSDTYLFRPEKAAYGLAEAPRAWFERLRRELLESGLVQSTLDSCLFMLIRDGELLGVCGIHVDDLLGGGEKAMDDVLEKLKKRLPFGDYRTHTIRYTGMASMVNRSRSRILYRCLAASRNETTWYSTDSLAWSHDSENLCWSVGLGCK